MKKIEISTSFKKLLADVYTPVGIYLRLRDRFRDTILMESTDFHAAENSYSFIGINAIAGIEIINAHQLEYKLPLKVPERIPIKQLKKVPELIWDFMQRFEIKEPAQKPINIAQGMFGYTTYDAIPFFENISFNHKSEVSSPRRRFRGGFQFLLCGIACINTLLLSIILKMNCSFVKIISKGWRVK